MDFKKIGFMLLDGFTRTWASFWGTWAVIFGWFIWNWKSNPTLHFDPLPCLLLMNVITILSYMQNIVIMTELKEEKAKSAAMEDLQRKMFNKMFDMVEEIHEEIGDAERQHQDAVPTKPKKTSRWRKNK